MRICMEEGIYGERIPYEPEKTNHNVYIKTNPENSAALNQSVIDKALSTIPIKRGEIVLADLGDNQKYCKIIGSRPVIVISSSKFNVTSPLITVIPITRTLRTVDAPEHIFIDKDDCINLKISGIILCEQMCSIDRTQVIKKMGAVTDARLMEKINLAAKRQIGVF